MRDCPKFNARVAVDLPNGTTLYGRAAGCVFGDPSAPHDCRDGSGCDGSGRARYRAGYEPCQAFRFAS
jgi:hypothetical protein